MKLRYSRWLLALVAVLLFIVLVRAQSPVVVPFMGIGNVQFFDNNGQVLTNGALYTYQAGTTTYQATYTDSTGTVLNTNPITFGTGGRVSIWLTNGATYKFILCVQNDGASCAPGDVLFSMDQVPATSGGGGGGGSSPFISSSPNPATSGILRLASSDTICFRNNANSGNICISKDSSDVLGWSGGSLKLPQIVAPSGSPNNDYLWADSTANRFMMSNNGSPAVQVVGSGVDINTSDQVTQLHFGSTPVPLSPTGPATGQALFWNGTQAVWGQPTFTPEIIFSWGAVQGNGGGVAACLAIGGGQPPYCLETVLTNAHTLNRLTYDLITAASGCSVNGVVSFRDATAGTNVSSLTLNVGSPGFVDSGALSVATTAGHVFALGVSTSALGCSQIPVISNLTAVLQ